MVTSKTYKNSLVFLFILFFISSSASWGMEDDENNETSINKTMKIEIDSEINNKNENSYSFFDFFKCVSIKKNTSIFVDIGIEILPKAVIKYLSNYLDFFSIIKLSHVNKKFRKFFDDDFWVNYNSINKYEVFSEECSYLLIWSYTKEISPIKISVANYYYKMGCKLYLEKKNSEAELLFKKAALLGFKISYRECVLCETTIPYNHDNFCPGCAHLAWDKCHVEKVKQERWKRKEEEQERQFFYEKINSLMKNDDDN